ncbi:uncharacterized protein LOC128389349 isoform X2 [Panonychus citri]|uniref:uncharacterized protein LOC128389349 isoform X2 n=1 Tax=Panonychus citri TaxID=50023 RepID=UPI0023077EAE|nr:uncharacterized protein LOC128389349 isoform X2 [Panonychus citri]
MSPITIVNLILTVLICSQLNGSIVSAQNGCPKHVIKYKIHSSLAHSQQLIETTLQEFNEKTNLEFIPEYGYIPDDSNVRFLFRRDNFECTVFEDLILLTPLCECKSHIIRYVMAALEVPSVPVISEDCENAQLSSDDVYTINSKYYCCSHYDNILFNGGHALNSLSGFTKKSTQNARNPWGAENIWTDSSIAYLIDDSLINSTSTIMEAIEEFNQKTCLKFKLRENESDYIVFKKGDSCKSLIGKINGEQPIELSFECYECKSRIVHELIHTIGFSLAEHSIRRPCEPGELSFLNIRRIDSVYC